jgi:cAMP phosphodiesterase
MLRTFAFQNTYQEELTLAGSRRLRLRIIQPTDKQKLAEGFQRLSRSLSDLGFKIQFF